MLRTPQRSLREARARTVPAVRRYTRGPMPDSALHPVALLRALWARQEIRFLVVGGANTVLSFGVFTALHAVLGDSVPYLVLLVPNYAIAIPIAFVSQRVLVFHVQGNVLVDLVRYTSVQLTGIALNAGVLAFAVEVLGLPVVVGQAVAIVVLVVVTYFSHRFFSFRRPPGHPGVA